MPCSGNGNDHCCYIKGKPCRFLITNYTDETGHFRKWACGLRAELGDWDTVLVDPRYKKLIAEKSWHPDVNCRDWPDGPVGTRGFYVCKECGANQ